MLVAFYRNGPRRQRLSKGFGLLSDGEIGSRVPAWQAALPPVCRRRPTLAARPGPAGWWSLSLDTGLHDLGTPDARNAWSADLATCVAALHATTTRDGARLLPGTLSGGRLEEAAHLPRDLHSLQALSAVEQEVLHNTLRLRVAPLIALTAVPAWTAAEGVTATGSARLAHATDHVRAGHVPSVAPQHLDHLRDTLRRRDGVTQLESMDVLPADVVDGVSVVTVRVVDAQVLLSTVRAHALLLQACAMQAGRWTGTGRRSPAGDTGALARDRARAVAAGLNARLEDPERPRGAADRSALNAGAVLLAFLESLRPELQALQASAEELAPLFVGLRLDADGFGRALRSEADLVAQWRAEVRAAANEQAGRQALAARLLDPAYALQDWMTTYNREVAPGRTASELARLEEWLAVPVVVPGMASQRERPSRGDRPQRRGRTAAAGRGSGAADRTASGATPTEAASAEKPAKLGPDADRAVALAAAAAAVRDAAAADVSRKDFLTVLGTYRRLGGRSLMQDLGSDAAGKQLVTGYALTKAPVARCRGDDLFDPDTVDEVEQSVKGLGIAVLVTPARGRHEGPHEKHPAQRVQQRWGYWTVLLRPVDERLTLLLTEGDV